MGLGGKLAVAFAVLVAATGVIIGAASYLTAGRQVEAEIDRFLQERANEIIDGTRPGPEDRSDRRSKDDGNLVVAVEPDTEVQQLAQDGSIVANSGLVLPVDARDAVIAGRNERAQLRTVTIDGSEYRLITQHIPGGGAVQVARSLDEADSLLGVLQSRLLVIAGVMAALAGMAGWWLARRVTRPLRSLSAAVDTVTETQDLGVSVASAGDDEVGHLARGFDRMLRALDLSREQQRRLVQDAAHELRTPLTSIKANIDWLSRADRLDAETQADTFASVQAELGELNDVITEIVELAMDRHELPPFAPVDLAVVTDVAVDRFRARSGRSIDLRLESTTVEGDSDSLRRAIANLLSNADKYSPPRLPVTVEVADGCVWVSDRGEGIPVQDRDRVFDRFYRRETSRPQPGSGLGLSIVAGIIDAHHGTVEVGEAEGGGAKVGFRLETVATATGLPDSHS